MNRNRWFIVLGVVVMTILPTLVWSTFIRTNEKPLTVNKFTWERSIPIERYQTVNEEAWHVPSGGRITSTFRKIHHYDTEYYSCSKYRNGEYVRQRCSRQEAVYHTAYRYDIDRWRYDYSLTTKANEHSKPFWPVVDPLKYNLKKDLALGDLKTGSNWQEKYVVVLTDGKHSYNKPVTFAVWESLKYGDVVTGAFNSMGSLRGVAWHD